MVHRKGTNWKWELGRMKGWWSAERGGGRWNAWERYGETGNEMRSRKKAQVCWCTAASLLLLCQPLHAQFLPAPPSFSIWISSSFSLSYFRTPSFFSLFQKFTSNVVDLGMSGLHLMCAEWSSPSSCCLNSSLHCSNDWCEGYPCHKYFSSLISSRMLTFEISADNRSDAPSAQ